MHLLAFRRHSDWRCRDDAGMRHSWQHNMAHGCRLGARLGVPRLCGLASCNVRPARGEVAAVAPHVAT